MTSDRSPRSPRTQPPSKRAEAGAWLAEKHVNRDPRAPLSQMSSHIGSIPIHSANQRDRDPRSARAEPLSKPTYPFAAAMCCGLNDSSRQTSSDAQVSVGSTTSLRLASANTSSGPASWTRGSASSSRSQGRRPARSASKPGRSRAETFAPMPRPPPPHSAHRACAVEVAARPFLLEESQAAARGSWRTAYQRHSDEVENAHGRLVEAMKRDLANLASTGARPSRTPAFPSAPDADLSAGPRPHLLRGDRNQEHRRSVVRSPPPNTPRRRREGRRRCRPEPAAYGKRVLPATPSPSARR